MAKYDDIELWANILESQDGEKKAYDEACAKRDAEAKALDEKRFNEIDEEEIDPKTMGITENELDDIAEDEAELDETIDVSEYDFSEDELNEADLREPLTAVSTALGAPASTANLDAQDSVTLAEAIKKLADALSEKKDDRRLAISSAQERLVPKYNLNEKYDVDPDEQRMADMMDDAIADIDDMEEDAADDMPELSEDPKPDELPEQVRKLVDYMLDESPYREIFDDNDDGEDIRGEIRKMTNVQMIAQRMAVAEIESGVNTKTMKTYFDKDGEERKLNKSWHDLFAENLKQLETVNKTAKKLAADFDPGDVADQIMSDAKHPYADQQEKYLKRALELMNKSFPEDVLDELDPEKAEQIANLLTPAEKDEMRDIVTTKLTYASLDYLRSKTIEREKKIRYTAPLSPNDIQAAKNRNGRQVGSDDGEDGADREYIDNELDQTGVDMSQAPETDDQPGRYPVEFDSDYHSDRADDELANYSIGATPEEKAANAQRRKDRLAAAIAGNKQAWDELQQARRDAGLPTDSDGTEENAPHKERREEYAQKAMYGIKNAKRNQTTGDKEISHQTFIDVLNGLPADVKKGLHDELAGEAQSDDERRLIDRLFKDGVDLTQAELAQLRGFGTGVAANGDAKSTLGHGSAQTQVKDKITYMLILNMARALNIADTPECQELSRNMRGENTANRAARSRLGPQVLNDILDELGLPTRFEKNIDADDKTISRKDKMANKKEFVQIVNATLANMWRDDVMTPQDKEDFLNRLGDFYDDTESRKSKTYLKGDDNRRYQELVGKAKRNLEDLDLAEFAELTMLNDMRMHDTPKATAKANAEEKAQKIAHIWDDMPLEPAPDASEDERKAYQKAVAKLERNVAGAIGAELGRIVIDFLSGRSQNSQTY